MRILIGTDTYFPNANGTSYFAQRLATQLVKRGHTVLVICPSRGTVNENYMHEGVSVFGIRSIVLSTIRKDIRVAVPLLERQEVQEQIEQFKPDIVHIQDHFTIGRLVYSLSKKASLPVVGTNHFLPENFLHYIPFEKVFQDTTRPLLSSIIWKEFRRMYEKLDVVTTPTQSSADEMKKRGFNKSIEVISNGIDLNTFSPTTKNGSIRKKYHIGNDTAFLYVGRLDKEKNLDIVLQSFASALKHSKSIFVIVGRGAEEERLRNLVSALNIEKHVVFTGFVPDIDLPAVYASMDCFIMAGTAELQSLVIMEAMASGLPILAAQAMALPELVKHGKNGYLFDIEKPAELTNYLLDITQDSTLRKNMSEYSLEFIQKHSLERTISRYEGLYKGLI